MMKKSLTLAVMTALVALAGVPAIAQDKAAAPAKATAAPAGKQLYSQATYDFLLKAALASGQPDSPELKNQIKDELNMRELLVREAKKKGLDKNPDVKVQMDIQSQTVLVNATIADWLKANPITDAELHKEYDVIKAQWGEKEYKVRHILVDKEDEAKDIIAELQKGTKFETLATRSKDPGSKDKGGDLDWNAPGNFVKPFSEAMVKLPKGKFTAQPVQTQFGWHVIEVDDIRDAKIPPFDDVKAQLQQKVQRQKVEAYMKELKAKNGV